MTDKWVSVGDSRLWTTSHGDGLPVLFLNGGPGCDDYLSPVSEMLEDLCQCVRFEPRGCGRSTWDGHYDLQTMVNDVNQVRLAYGFDKVVLLGHSFGPDLGLAYSLSYPTHVHALIAVAGGRIVNDRSWHAAYAENRHREESPKEYSFDPDVNRLGNETYKAFIKTPDLLRQIADMKTPCFYIAAGSDIRPNWPIRQLAGLISHSEYQEIGAAGHYIWTSHTNELSKALRKIVSKISCD